MKRIIAGIGAAAALLTGAYQIGRMDGARVQTFSPQAIYGVAVVDGDPVFVPLDAASTATPSAPATQTAQPTHAPTATRTAQPTPTPLEVTPIAPTPAFPRNRQAYTEYVPIYKLRIRTAPQTGDNWTGFYTLAGERYMIYHVREYANGEVWGCMDEVHPNDCRRWFAIMFLVNGILEEYARPAEDLDG